MPVAAIMSGYGPGCPPMGANWAQAAWPDPKTATSAVASMKVLDCMAVSPEVAQRPQVGIGRYRPQIAIFWNNPQSFCRFPQLCKKRWVTSPWWTQLLAALLSRTYGQDSP